MILEDNINSSSFWEAHPLLYRHTTVLSSSYQTSSRSALDIAVHSKWVKMGDLDHACLLPHFMNKLYSICATTTTYQIAFDLLNSQRMTCIAGVTKYDFTTRDSIGRPHQFGSLTSITYRSLLIMTSKISKIWKSKLRSKLRSCCASYGLLQVVTV